MKIRVKSIKKGRKNLPYDNQLIVIFSPSASKIARQPLFLKIYW